MGEFGYSLSANAGTFVVGASLETAFGLAYAGKVYLLAVGMYAVLDRYNSPNVHACEEFRGASSGDAGGVITVGAPGNGDQSETTNPGHAFESLL